LRSNPRPPRLTVKRREERLCPDHEHLVDVLVVGRN
jgi:hypothetical protein